MKQKLKFYCVCSAETWSQYGEYEPREYGRDCVEIEAKNKKEARILGLKELRKQYPRGIHNERDENPFQDMIVEEMCCINGNCKECKKQEAEYLQSLKK